MSSNSERMLNMRKKAWLFFPVVLATVITGCSNDDASAPATTTVPAPIGITVSLTDSVPMNGFQNEDDKICSPTPAFVRPGTQTYDPQVTVQDASGKIVATQNVVEFGTMGDDGCTIQVRILSVPFDDFYTVTLRDPFGEEHSETVQNNGRSELPVLINF